MDQATPTPTTEQLLPETVGDKEIKDIFWKYQEPDITSYSETIDWLLDELLKTPTGPEAIHTYLDVRRGPYGVTFNDPDWGRSVVATAFVFETTSGAVDFALKVLREGVKALESVQNSLLVNSEMSDLDLVEAVIESEDEDILLLTKGTA